MKFLRLVTILGLFAAFQTANAQTNHQTVASCVEFGPTAYQLPKNKVASQTYVAKVLSQFHNVKRAVFKHATNSTVVNLESASGNSVARLNLSADLSKVSVIDAKVQFPDYQVSTELSPEIHDEFSGTLYFSVFDEGDIAKFALKFYAPNTDGACVNNRY